MLVPCRKAVTDKTYFSNFLRLSATKQRSPKRAIRLNHNLVTIPQNRRNHPNFKFALFPSVARLTKFLKKLNVMKLFYKLNVF